MGGNSYDTHGEGSASAYWRRRFIVLAIGLVVFGLAAWGLSDALAVKAEPASRAGRTGSFGQLTGPGSARSGHDSRDGSGSSRSGGRDQSRQGASGRSASGRSASGRSASGQGGSGNGRSGSGRGDQRGQSRQAGGGQPAGSGSAGGQPGNGGVAGGQSKPGAGQAAGQGTILPAFCGQRDIVLSVFAGQTQFAPKDSPTFELSIVSTQPAECTFNIGSAHLVLVIKEGPATIWSSADCPTGTPSLDAALARGVPTVVTVTWHRKTSAPGCSSRTTRVPPGSYTATAQDGSLTSQPIPIHLN
ncbi:MAG TPA: hypothetical protein VFI65_11820 [Streptosporangiaceae bacterium]|nr:hypothetical protein [Streptosporangiaceae bacterium]